MTSTQILGAISTKGRAPLLQLVDGFIRRRHLHPAGTRCVELRTPETESTESTEPPSAPDWLDPPVQDPALGDEPPADTTPAVGDVTATIGGYIGRHHSNLEAEWKPAHVAGRHRARHTRPAGERPDLRIEHTDALSIERIRQILADGAPC